MEKVELKVNERFFSEACRNMGVTDISAIHELIDNSKDANTTKITVCYNHETKILSVIDNGSGMSYQTLKKAMEFSPENEKSEKGIGFYGVGLKTSLLNLADIVNGSDVTITTTNNGKTNRVLWKIQKGHVKNYIIESVETDINTNNGTIIDITNIKLDFNSLNKLYKYLGVVYFPSLSKGEFELYMNCTYEQKIKPPHGLKEISFINLKVEPTDPLYRDKRSFILSEDGFIATIIYNGVTYEIPVKTVLLSDMTEETPIPWDTKRGNDGGVRSLVRSGAYGIYGGRYIELGDNLELFGIPRQQFYAGSRAEFEIPKALTELFGVKFNKTSGIKKMTNICELEELVRKLKNKFEYYKSNFEHQSKRSSKKEKINSLEINTKKFDIIEKGYGHTDIPWTINYEDRKTVVTLNVDSKVYNSVVSNAKNTSELKNIFKMFSAVLAATCEELFQDDNRKKIEAYSILGKYTNEIIKRQ